MSDLDEIFPNYEERNAAGESWESMALNLENSGAPDKRLAAFLRQRAAGESPEAVTEPPAQRSGGQKSVAAQEAAAADTAADAAATAVADTGGDK